MQFTTFIPHWFDLLTLICLGVGLRAGRKRGMSEELLRVVQWLLIVIVGAHAYRTPGAALADWMKIQPVVAYTLVYLGIAIGIKIVFNLIRQVAGEKLAGKDTFGRAEYYLGMFAGTISAACMLLMALAFLNAKHITPEEIERVRRLQKDNFGDISFPTLGSIQQEVFHKSLAGKWVKENLPQLLIVSTPAGKSDSKKKDDSLGKRRQDTLDEITSPKKP